MVSVRPLVRRALFDPSRRTLGALTVRRAFASAPLSRPEIYDVVCIGAGPVGLGLVAALRSNPFTSSLRIALVESQDLTRTKQWQPSAEEYSNRASSLTPTTVSFLQDIGAWNHVDQERVQPYNEMQVWDGSNNSRIQFDWKAEAQKYNSIPRIVATMAENNNLTRALMRRLEELGGQELNILSNTKVASIDSGMDDPDSFNMSAWPVLTLKSTDGSTEPPTIAARLLVGADGANSPARTFAGIASNGWDYSRHGVVASLMTSPVLGQSSDHPVAYQRFIPAMGGPIALLPLPDNRASLVWSTTPQNAAYLKALPARTFVTMVNAAFRLSQADLKYMLSLPPSPEGAHEDEMDWRIPHTDLPAQIPPTITDVQPATVASFPLKFKQADTYISPRVALVGDAAHTIHPLAGQGLNLGLGDARSLAATITYTLEHGGDIGDVIALEQYNSDRWATNAKVGGTCDLLHKMYNVESGPVAWARGLGLSAIGAVPWAKEFFMRQAEG